MLFFCLSFFIFLFLLFVADKKKEKRIQIWRPLRSSSVQSRKLIRKIRSRGEEDVNELKEALDADIQDRIMEEREMQSYIQEREREVSEREAAWKAELSRREVIFLLLISLIKLIDS